MRIIQFTDLHFGSWPLNEEDKKTLMLIKKMIDEYNPDFIAITGDLIWGKQQNVLKTFEFITSFIDDFNIQFGITFGNHDSEGEFTREKLWEIVSNTENHVVMEQKAIHNDRVSYLHTSQNGAKLFFVDSGSYIIEPFKGYAYILPEQQDWLMKQFNDEISEKHLFIHIPLPEYKMAVDEGLAHGNQDEEVCASNINSGLWCRMFANKNKTNIYCGHDHDNDFSADFFGVKLNYGRVTGYNSYGRLNRGARIIDIDEKGKSNTFIVE